MDLGIEVILKLFSKDGLRQLFEASEKAEVRFSENAERIYAMQKEYLNSIDQVISFLQGRNATFARQICTDNYLPQASRFEELQELDYAFGHMGLQDKAKHLATLYLEDLSDFIIETIDPHFGFSRYAERLGRSANHFDELYEELAKPLSLIDQITLNILSERIDRIDPELICFSVPFPGNLFSAFRCGQYIKKHYPGIKIAMGGGFPNTELRTLSDKRVFEFVDFITLDDGEKPIEQVIKYVNTADKEVPLKRTFLLEGETVVFKNDKSLKDYKQSEVGTPDYSDLLLNQYISVIEVTNPMHSLWSDGRWNKLTMAHGCYWGKCTFCDISLDYIRLYEPIAAKQLVDRMEQIIAQTGETGFHFVDEAAPPALMRELALEIIRRDLTVSWWTNIRFEKSFTFDLCQLLKASGCIAVSGGLEVATDRLLDVIKKGVTVAQVANVTRNLTASGIMVHAYLMYGYPTQTEQETIDSLEMVRQLFELGVLQSGFWHQFALTAHSPVGLNPDHYGIHPVYPEHTFANNDLAFTDTTGINHDKFSFGLKKSLFNFMQGIGFDFPLQDWFDFKVPKTTISPDYITNCLNQSVDPFPKSRAKMIWVGNLPILAFPDEMTALLTIHQKAAIIEVALPKQMGIWLAEWLKTLSNGTHSFDAFQQDFESQFDDFQSFWLSEEIMDLRENGLLIL
ncbi:radical SAM protein [Marivirga atlantica]